MKTVYRNAGKRQSLDSIRDCFAVMVLTGEYVSRELVYNKLEWNGYPKFTCEEATDIIMAELKLFGNPSKWEK